jgi:hypothetical protein
MELELEGLDEGGVTSCQLPKESEEIHCQALGLRERVQGQEHPNTLTSMNNLANVLREPVIRLTQLKPLTEQAGVAPLVWK